MDAPPCRRWPPPPPRAKRRLAERPGTRAERARVSPPEAPPPKRTAHHPAPLPTPPTPPCTRCWRSSRSAPTRRAGGSRRRRRPAPLHSRGRRGAGGSRRTAPRACWKIVTEQAHARDARTNAHRAHTRRDPRATGASCPTRQSEPTGGTQPPAACPPPRHQGTRPGRHPHPSDRRSRAPEAPRRSVRTRTPEPRSLLPAPLDPAPDGTGPQYEGEPGRPSPGQGPAKNLPKEREDDRAGTTQQRNERPTGGATRGAGGPNGTSAPPPRPRHRRNREGTTETKQRRTTEAGTMNETEALRRKSPQQRRPRRAEGKTWTRLPARPMPRRLRDTTAPQSPQA